MANGFFSRLRRVPIAPPKANFNQKNLNSLNTKVRGLVFALRTLKKTVPTNFQTTNAFKNATKTERNALNTAVVNFIVKYNKAVNTVNVAAAAVTQPTFVPPSKPLPPTPTAAVQQARQATQQATAAAQRVQKQVETANKYASMSSNNIAREANRTNLSPNAKAKLVKIINNKLQTLNRTSRQYELLLNAKTRLAGPPPLPPKPTQSQNNQNLAYLNSLGSSPTANQLNKVQSMLSNPFSSNAVKIKARSILNMGLTNLLTEGKVALPRPNANVFFLQQIGNRKPTNAEYKRVVNISKSTKNPIAKKLAEEIINRNIQSRL